MPGQGMDTQQGKSTMFPGPASTQSAFGQPARPAQPINDPFGNL